MGKSPDQLAYEIMLADRIISISGATDMLLESKGYSAKTQKIYLGIDTDKFAANSSGVVLRKDLGIADEVFVFGCAAQFVEWKNQGILLDAFERLCARYSDTVLLMCGGNHQDAYFEKIRDRVSSSAYTERIFLLGTLDDMPRFYSALNCFVLPSANETFRIRLYRSHELRSAGHWVQYRRSTGYHRCRREWFSCQALRCP